MKAQLLAILTILTIVLTGCLGNNVTSENEELKTQLSELKAKEIPITEINKQKPNDYLLFMYQDECLTCDAEIEILKQYQELEGSLPVYLVNLSVLDQEIVRNEIIDIPVGVTVRIRENKIGIKQDEYRWYELNNVNQLPLTGEDSYERERTYSELETTEGETENEE